MTINPTTRLVLDSNIYIFGLAGNKISCIQLLENLDALHVFVPLMVVREVERNLESTYRLGSRFFQLIGGHKNITVIWSPPPEKLIKAYIERGFSSEDAAIAATIEEIQAEYLVSENRHFLQRSDFLSFKVINAEAALKLLQGQ